jgi:hypothetical protein
MKRAGKSVSQTSQSVKRARVIAKPADQRPDRLTCDGGADEAELRLCLRTDLVNLLGREQLAARQPPVLAQVL